MIELPASACMLGGMGWPGARALSFRDSAILADARPLEMVPRSGRQPAVRAVRAGRSQGAPTEDRQPDRGSGYLLVREAMWGSNCTFWPTFSLFLGPRELLLTLSRITIPDQSLLHEAGKPQATYTASNCKKPA